MHVSLKNEKSENLISRCLSISVLLILITHLRGSVGLKLHRGSGSLVEISMNQYAPGPSAVMAINYYYQVACYARCAMCLIKCFVHHA